MAVALSLVVPVIQHGPILAVTPSNSAPRTSEFEERADEAQCLHRLDSRRDRVHRGAREDN